MEEPSSRRFVLLVVVAVLLAAGIGIALAAWRSGGDDSSGSTEPAVTLPGTVPVTASPVVSVDPEAQVDNAAQFLNAWAQSRRVEAVVEYQTIRTESGGAQARSRSVLVQAPPQRLFGEFGSFGGILQGEAVACDATLGDVYCDQAEAEGDFFVALEAEVAVLRNLFVGDPRTYWVTPQSASCFVLTLAEEVVRQPFGRTATLCFDSGSGVLRSSEYRFGNGVVEQREATAIRLSVTAADFQAIIDSPPT